MFRNIYSVEEISIVQDKYSTIWNPGVNSKRENSFVQERFVDHERNTANTRNKILSIPFARDFVASYARGEERGLNLAAIRSKALPSIENRHVGHTFLHQGSGGGSAVSERSAASRRERPRCSVHRYEHLLRRVSYQRSNKFPRRYFQSRIENSSVENPGQNSRNVKSRAQMRHELLQSSGRTIEREDLHKNAESLKLKRFSKARDAVTCFLYTFTCVIRGKRMFRQKHILKICTQRR